MTAEEGQRWREYAQRLQRAPSGEEAIATGIGIDKLLDALDQAAQRAESLSNARSDEREQNESVHVALNEKTAEVARLTQQVRDLEEMLRIAGKP